MKKLFFMSLAFVATVTMNSCGDKTETPIKPDDVSGEMEKLSPSKSKEFLTETASEFMDKFHAADQRELITLAAYFDETYANLDFPEEFEVEADDVISHSDLRNMIHNLSTSISAGNPSRAASVVTEYVYTLNFERFAGVYEPGRREWLRTGSSNDIVFKFKGNDNQECVLKVSASKETSDHTINITDNWTDWYDDVEYEDQYKYSFSVPKKVTLTLTSGSTELVKAIVDSNINVSGHTVSVTTNITAMNVVISAKVTGNDTQANIDASLKVGNEQLITSTATIKGSHLCDIDYYQKDNIKATTLFESGTSTVSVLNKVRIDAQVNYNKLIEEIFDYPYWNSYNYTSKGDAKAAAEQAIETINKSINAQVRYNNKQTIQATLTFGTGFDSWGTNYWEYYMEPLLVFSADETSYSFEEYFAKGFASVEDTWSDLQNSYSKVWNSIRK